MTMIEVAARAYDPIGWKWHDAAADDHPAKPVFRQYSLSRTRAAIASLRVPTERMIYVRYLLDHNVISHETFENFVRLYPGYIEDERRYACAMIDAALAEPTTEE